MSRLADNPEHLRKIIYGLFNPVPDKHADGCLSLRYGPCQCGYSEVAGKYLWALRAAKEIAAEHFGAEAVAASHRLQEPSKLVQASADAPSGFSSIDFKMLFDALRMAESQIAYLDPKKQSARTADALEQVGIALKAVAAASRSAAIAAGPSPGRQAEGVTSPCEFDPEGFKKYAAPTTSPTLKVGLVELQQLADEQESLAKSFRAMHDTEEARAYQIRAQALRLQATTSPEPSAIFHATSLAAERLARITAPEPDAVRKDYPDEAKIIVKRLRDVAREAEIDGGFDWMTLNTAAEYIERKLAALSAPVAGAWQEIVASCKGEHLKFEEWAKAKRYDMHEHPMHYLFLDEKTYAARQGWKAALEYVASSLARNQCAPPQPITDGSSVKGNSYIETHPLNEQMQRTQDVMTFFGRRVDGDRK